MTHLTHHLSIPGRLRRLWRSDPSLRHGTYAVATVAGAVLLYIVGGFGVHAKDVRPLAGTSITPITSVAAGSSGLAFSGDAYEVSCTVSAAAGTLYPAVHDGTAWTVYYLYPCALDGTVVTKATCIFPAKRGTGLTWNAFKTGAATINACTAEQRYTAGGTSSVPPVPPAAAAASAVRKELYYYSGPAQITSSQSDVYGFSAVGGYEQPTVSTALPFAALRAGSITGIAFHGNSTSVVAGSITIKAFKNSSAVAGAELVVTSGQQARTTFAAGTYTFAAGDLLDPRWTTTGTYNGPATAGFTLEITE